MLLFYSAHHHAEMARFNDHANSLWLDGFLNGLGNLRGQPLLDLQAAGEDFDQARNLAQADDFAVRNICDVNFAKERQDVVLAEAEHLDIFHDHHFVVTDRKQRLLQHGLWIFFVALGQKFEGAVDAMRSADETFADWVFIKTDEDFFDQLFEAGAGKCCGFDWCHGVFLYGRASLGWAGEGTHPYVVVPIASGGFRHPRRIRMSSSWFLPCVPFLDERCGNRAAKYRTRRCRGSPSSQRNWRTPILRLDSAHRRVPEFA